MASKRAKWGIKILRRGRRVWLRGPWGRSSVMVFLSRHSARGYISIVDPEWRRDNKPVPVTLAEVEAEAKGGKR